MKTVAAPARSPLDDQSLRRSFTPKRKVKAIVRSEVAGGHLDRAAIRAFVEIETGKLHDTRVATVKTDIALLNCLFVDLKLDLDVIPGRVAEVADVDHEVI